MTAENVLRAKLLATPAVVALVAERIYPAEGVPQGSPMPVIAHDRISAADGVLDLDGDTAPDEVRVQLNCWATSYDAAMAVAAAVRTALQGWAGQNPQGSTQKVECGAPRKMPKDQELKLFGFRMDALVTIQEAA
jgi:hypothetical protein